jgi:hypothetical protein
MFAIVLKRLFRSIRNRLTEWWIRSLEMCSAPCWEDLPQGLERSSDNQNPQETIKLISMFFDFALPVDGYSPAHACGYGTNGVMVLQRSFGRSPLLFRNLQSI